MWLAVIQEGAREEGVKQRQEVVEGEEQIGGWQVVFVAIVVAVVAVVSVVAVVGVVAVIMIKNYFEKL